MVRNKLEAIVLQSIEDGPAIIFNENNKQSLGYVIFVREGTKWFVFTIDKTFADLGGPSVEFMIAEMQSYLTNSGITIE